MPLFTRLSVNCFGARMDYEHPERTVFEGVANMESFIKSIGLPTRLSEVGITSDGFEFCADLAIETSDEDYIGSAIRLYRQDIVNVYRLAE